MKTLLPGSLRHTHPLHQDKVAKRGLLQAIVRGITRLTLVKGIGCSHTDFVKGTK